MTSIKSGWRLVSFYACTSIIVLLSGSFRPLLNWDLIAYLGSAKALETNDPVQIHSFAYAEVEKTPGTRPYSTPASPVDSPFRSLMRTDYPAFSAQLAFYKVRVIYVLIVYLLISAGVSAVFATHFISAVSVFAAIWFLFFIGRNRFSIPLQYAILPIALALGGLEIARLSTPDALAFLITLAAVYFFLTESNVIYSLFPLMVAVRTDLLILVLLLSLSMLMVKQAKKTLILVFLLVSTGTLALIHWYYGYPGWTTIFYFTFFDRMAFAAPGELGVGKYLITLVKGSWMAFRSPEFLFFSTIGGLALFSYWRKFRNSPLSQLMESKSLILLMVSVLYITVRMMLFPLPDARFLVVSYVIATISFFDLLSEDYRTQQVEATH